MNFSCFNQPLTEGKIMKILKLVYPMTLALAVTLAATGCRNHRPYGVTPIPNGQGGLVNNPGEGGTLPGGNQPGGGQQANINGFDNMTQDRAALAAYTIHFAFDSSVIRHSEARESSIGRVGLELRPQHQADRSRAIATSAAPRNTIVRSAIAAPWPRVRHWPSWALIQTASAP